MSEGDAAIGSDPARVTSRSVRGSKRISRPIRQADQTNALRRRPRSRSRSRRTRSRGAARRRRFTSIRPQSKATQICLAFTTSNENEIGVSRLMRVRTSIGRDPRCRASVNRTVRTRPARPRSGASRRAARSPGSVLLHGDRDRRTIGGYASGSTSTTASAGVTGRELLTEMSRRRVSSRSDGRDHSRSAKPTAISTDRRAAPAGGRFDRCATFGRSAAGSGRALFARSAGEGYTCQVAGTPFSSCDEKYIETEPRAGSRAPSCARDQDVAGIGQDITRAPITTAMPWVLPLILRLARWMPERDLDPEAPDSSASAAAHLIARPARGTWRRSRRQRGPPPCPRSAECDPNERLNRDESSRYRASPVAQRCASTPPLEHQHRGDPRSGMGGVSARAQVD